MPLIAPFILAALVGGFATGIAQGIIKALLSVGVGFVLYSGIDVLLSSIATHIISNLDGLPFAGILHVLNVDKCINVLVSAYTVRLVLKGVTNGISKHLVLHE